MATWNENSVWDPCMITRYGNLVLEHQVLQEEVLVLGRLTADGIVKTQFGTSSIMQSSEIKKS